MTASANSALWWLVPIYGFLWGAVMFVYMWLLFRKRRWRDRSLLSKAVSMPPEHVTQKPREVRDLRPGESAWVSRHSIVTSKKRNRVFVAWTANVEAAPENPDSDFAPLPIKRLKRGFSLTVRPGFEFRTSPLPWGDYAPVIEIARDTAFASKAGADDQ